MFNLFKNKFKDESLEDQKKDLERYPEFMVKESLEGLDCDVLPNATGDFGRTKTNPIPVNGPIGEIKYLNRLRTSDGGLIFHRVGSVDGNLDKYEVVSLGGKIWDVLYFDMYHPRRSTIAPSEYSFSEFNESFIKLALGYYTNGYAENFPFGLEDLIEKHIGGTLGVRIANQYKEIIKDKSKFVRPSEQIKKLDQL